MNKSEQILQKIEEVTNLHTFIVTPAATNKGKFTTDPGKPVSKHNTLNSAKRTVGHLEAPDDLEDEHDNDSGVNHHIHHVTRVGEDRYRVNSTHTKIDNRWVEHTQYKGKHVVGKVDPDLDFTTDHNESASRSLTRMHQHMNSGRSVGIISAMRTHDDKDAGGDGHKFSPKELNQRHQALKDDIKKAGYGYTEGHGFYKGEHERSIRVFSKEKGHDNGLKDFLTTHGTKYAQDSIIHKPHDSDEAHLHFTMNRDGNKIGDSFPVGKMRAQRTGKWGHTNITRGAASAKPGKTAPGEKGFVFSNGSQIDRPKDPGQAKDDDVWLR